MIQPDITNYCPSSSLALLSYETGEPEILFHEHKKFPQVLLPGGKKEGIELAHETAQREFAQETGIGPEYYKFLSPVPQVGIEPGRGILLPSHFFRFALHQFEMVDDLFVARLMKPLPENLPRDELDRPSDQVFHWLGASTLHEFQYYNRTIPENLHEIASIILASASDMTDCHLPTGDYLKNKLVLH